MNSAAFERAQVAGFAYQQARRTGSLDAMKAICYVLRNRVRAGWGDGTWLSAIRAQAEYEANDAFEYVPLDLSDRLLQMLIRDIDDIYMGTSADDLTREVVKGALYWQFADKPPRIWFMENIVRDPKHHPRIGQVGFLILFA